MEKEYLYEQETIITADRVTPSKTLSVFAAADLLQNSASLHSISMGIDDVTLKEKFGLFWVAAHIVITLNNVRCMNEPALVKTWVRSTSRMKSERLCSISCKNGIVAEGRCEWAMLDMNTHRPVRFPDEVKADRWAYDTDDVDVPKFSRIKPDFGEDDFVMERRVMSGDIDISMHTNNAVYCRFLTDMFSAQFLTENPISTFEIVYVKESREGDVLKLYRKFTDSNTAELGAYNENGETVVAARAVFKKQ